jgi:hypothetical protein
MGILQFTGNFRGQNPLFSRRSHRKIGVNAGRHLHSFHLSTSSSRKSQITGAEPSGEVYIRGRVRETETEFNDARQLS